MAKTTFANALNVSPTFYQAWTSLSVIDSKFMSVDGPNGTEPAQIDKELMPTELSSNYTDPISVVSSKGTNITYSVTPQRGTPFDPFTFLIGSSSAVVVERDFFGTDVVLPVPPGSGGPYKVYVTLPYNGHQYRSFNYQTIQYDSSKVQTTTVVGTNGGQVTITGSIYYEELANLVVKVGPTPCTNLQVVVPAQTITCTLAPTDRIIVQNQSLVITHLGVNSPAFNFSYLSPYILQSTPGLANITSKITITGNYFGQYLSVSIGGDQCYNVTRISDKVIHCLFDGKVPQANNKLESLPVNVTSSGISDCNGHGDIDLVFGRCLCHPGWTYNDCSLPTSPGGLPIIQNGTAINPSKVNFINSIVYLRESDSVGTIVRTRAMSTIEWTANNITGELIGRFPSDQVTVYMNVTLVTVSQTILFAGESINLPANSVKFSVAIAKWTLNNLEVIFESRTVAKLNDDCGTKTKLAQNDDASSYYVVAGQSVLSGSFATHMYVEDRVVFSKVIILPSSDPLYSALNNKNNNINADDKEYKVLTSIVVPYFKSHCLIDPSFQSLVAVDDITNCQPKSYKVIIIAVVCSVVGAAILLLAMVFVIKHKYNILSRLRSNIKLKNSEA
ncbi:hypothetical protein SAMD00019534_123920 [Acytostelium subglobosum LB1]|uniref:hypothetical protein n=1 Tax=Acytostelium subglobosum LB1 TaxID=1410327 RepID=UPI000644AE0B|nr:hypothetical protein SAMD00019534_123920 [Acytostelium subglobosum LB1]GAM29216.1 hypothetical protein SAMD00019534_123920 [Acytostelium subglobosum LB1]|eukprot:XP_012747907.1 hypothetical protein SAMD00019534_123920 [Acytostelium subglobosum LB1]